MRIALTHQFCWPEVRRGGERYLHELAASLHRRGHKVTIVAGATRSSIHSEDGVRVVRIRHGEADDAHAGTRLFRKMRIVLSIGRFDVVHSLGPRDASVSILAARGRRRYRTVYTNLGNPVRSWWQTQPDGPAHDHVVSEIDAYGCLSEFARSSLRAEYGRDGVLTPGGVDTTRFRPVAEREPAPTLLYSGVIDEPRKGVASLLEALALLASDVPNVQLWLSGSGDPSGLLDGAPPDARERTHVLPMGTPADQPARYSRAWATVLPSIHEAFGLALIESLACGTPIVGSDHAALPELVRPGIGTLAVPQDARSLAEACGRALELAQRPSTRNECRDAAYRHDWDASVTPLIESVYERDTTVTSPSIDG